MCVPKECKFPTCNAPVDVDHRTQNMSTCAICLEEVDTEETCNLSCGHAFHSRCIQKWLVVEPSCPVCRAPSPACQHGDLCNHGPGVLSEIIRLQSTMLSQRDAELSELRDTIVALRTSLEGLYGARHESMNNQLVSFLFLNSVEHLIGLHDE